MRKPFPLLTAIVSLFLATDILGAPAMAPGPTRFGPPSMAPGRDVPAPPIAPTRGVISPLVQLSPVASLDMFMSDLRTALQEGAVPDVSLFHQFGRVFDQRYYELYPDFLRIAVDLYQRAVSGYEDVSRSQGMKDAQMTAIYSIRTQTLENVKKIEAAARVASRTQAEAKNSKLENAVRSLRGQFPLYKGNPNTLRLPLQVIPRSEAGDVAHVDRGARSHLSILQELAVQQLRMAGDFIGSGTIRSNEWLQLLREYRQAEITRDAAVKHFNPNFDVKSIAR